MAKIKTGRLLLLIFVISILVAGLVFGIIYAVKNTAVSGGNTDPNACGDSTGILTLNAITALEGGTDPSSPTITCGVNGGAVSTAVTSGTTTFAIGSELECLVSKADYIDTVWKETMACGGLVGDVKMYYATSDNPSLTLRDPNNGDATLSDSFVGATNLTNIDAGATVEFDVEFKGTNGEGTGEMIYVIEFPAGSSANITDVTMGGLVKLDNVPNVYTSQNAGSYVVAFAVPNIEGAIKKEYSVIATLGSGKDLMGGIYTDWFAGQSFIDDDKSISSGVQDSDGTAKYENTGDYDIFVNNA